MTINFYFQPVPDFGADPLPLESIEPENIPDHAADSVYVKVSDLLPLLTAITRYSVLDPDHLAALSELTLIVESF